MSTTRHFFHRMRENEEGAVATEYALLIGFIALAVFSVVMSFGEAVLGLFDKGVALFP